MRTRHVMWATTLVAFAVAGALALGASAAQAQNKCLAGKTKCVNKKVAGLLKCQEKCQKDPAKCGGAETACEDKVLAKFNGASDPESCFGKLEAKNDGPCVTFDDRAEMETKVYTFVVDVRGALEAWPTPTATHTPAVTATPTPRFVDNGNGTVTDNQTGLQWEQKVAGSGCLHCVDDTKVWSDAMGNWISEVNGYSADGTTQTGLGGHSDWRMPTSAELQAILLASYVCGTSPCINPIFGPTAASGYWSTTTYDAPNPVNAWYVSFDDGNVHALGKTGINHVRAVRGGTPVVATGTCPGHAGGRFTANGDGTVTDNCTRLQWEQKVAGSGCLHCVSDTMTWDAAMGDWISEVNGYSADGTTQAGLGGHSDWRMPTNAELQTIISGGGPVGSAIINSAFGSTAASYYWSSTTYAYAPFPAWFVSFDDGGVGNYYKFLVNFYVRAVRGGS